MKKTGSIILILICVIFCCTGCGKQKEKEAPVANEQEYANTVESQNIVTLAEGLQSEILNVTRRNCMVQINTDIGSGSGILWEQEADFWVFVTASHVIETATYAEVCFETEGEAYKTDVYTVSGLDLAFLKVSTMDIREDILGTYAECLKSGGAVEQGQSVVATGYDSYGNNCEYSGSVLEPWIYTEDFGNCMLLCDCGAQNGMSGGGVFTTKGMLCGLICGKSEENILAVLPVSVIKSEYQIYANY